MHNPFILLFSHLMTMSARCSPALTEAGQKASPLLPQVCLMPVSSSAALFPVSHGCGCDPRLWLRLAGPRIPGNVAAAPGLNPTSFASLQKAEPPAPGLPAPSPRSAPAVSPPLAGAGAAREEEPPPPRFLRPSPPGGSGAWHRLRQLRRFLEPPSAGSRSVSAPGAGSRRGSRLHGARGGAAALGGAGAARGGGRPCLRAGR